MKATELRIGNLIYRINRSNTVHMPDEIPIEIVALHVSGIQALREGETLTTQQIPWFIDYPNIEPIPLTEEWLVKFGFNHIDDKLYCKRWRLNRVDIYKMISGNYPFYFRFNQVDLKVKHVHQLQNLYFSLTGEELNLK